MKLLRRNEHSRSGFTLTEVAIGSVVLLTLSGIVAESMSTMRRSTFTGSAQAIGNQQVERALDRIVEDLRRSGFVEMNGGLVPYPHVFQDGDPAPAYDAFGEHQHAVADENADAGDPDFGADQEILFLLPEDADGDGAPDIDPGTGSIVWNENVEVSYTLVTQADGTNVLLRRVTGEAPRTVARGVERIWFDTPPTAAFQIPLGTIRVRIWVRTTDGTGTEHRTTAEVVVRLRNGSAI